MRNKKENVRKLEKFRIESENGLIFEKKNCSEVTWATVSVGTRKGVERNHDWTDSPDA